MAKNSWDTSSPMNGDEIKILIKEVLEREAKSVFSNSDEDVKKISSFAEISAQQMSKSILEKVDNPSRDKKLEILYNHEKHYLDILKEYKEEIKFASSLQAEIRKEEATFFASTLKEVCNSLKETQIDPKYQVQWIFDLVSSYTSSLRLSSKLAEEHVINLLGDIQETVNETIKND